MPRYLWIVNVVIGLLLLAAVLWAEGGVSNVLAEPALVAFVLVSLALFAAAGFTKASLSPGVREDRGNRWVLPVFAILGYGGVAVSLACDRANIYTLDGSAVRWFGVALYAVGGVLRLAPVFVLGRRFSGLVAIQPGHTLVTDGIYARIRNPSYLGLLVNAVGMALVFRSAPGAALALLLLIPLHARMVAEERLLEDTFGDEYRRYRARTARLIPGLY
jgi:protein-S-isoprenylcysteine O-methyltransferase Ste14